MPPPGENSKSKIIVSIICIIGCIGSAISIIVIDDGNTFLFGGMIFAIFAAVGISSIYGHLFPHASAVFSRQLKNGSEFKLDGHVAMGIGTVVLMFSVIGGMRVFDSSKTGAVEPPVEFNEFAFVELEEDIQEPFTIDKGSKIVDISLIRSGTTRPGTGKVRLYIEFNADASSQAISEEFFVSYFDEDLDLQTDTFTVSNKSRELAILSKNP